MNNRASLPMQLWKPFKAAVRGPMIALIGIFVFLWISTPSFFDTANFINIMGQITIYGMLAFGMTIVIISGGIDLSVGNVLSLATMVFGWSAKTLGLPIGVAVLLAILAGALCGLGNGLMITKAKLPAFIATLSMLYISRGLAHIITNGKQILDYPEWFRAYAFTYYFGFLSVTTAVFIILVVICWIFLAHRESGRNLYAVGGNPEVARLAGIRVALVTTGAYVASGMLAGLAGVIYASRVNASTPLAGDGYELKAIAIAVIGGASLINGGVGTIGGTVIGTLILGLLMNGLNLHGLSPHIQTISIGVVIAIAVFFDMLSRKKK